MVPCLQLANYSANAAEKDARDTEDADKSKNVSVATYKAAQAAQRSQEAAEAASDAEKLAVQAAEYAAKASTALALDHALAAAQAFNQVGAASSKNPFSLACVLWALCHLRNCSTMRWQRRRRSTRWKAAAFTPRC